MPTTIIRGDWLAVWPAPDGRYKFTTRTVLEVMTYLHRYPLVASTVKAFNQSVETGKYEWKPFVYTIFDKAPVLEVVLEHFADALIPTAWSGSRAEILEKRAVLYENLYGHDNEEIAAWAENQYKDL